MMKQHQQHQAEHDSERLIITIDGPAGGGKTTVAQLLATRLNYDYIDTGALYRGVAFEVQSKGIDPDQDEALAVLCKTIRLEFVSGPRGLRLLSDSVDITDHIRSPDITMSASSVSAKPIVRRFLLTVQHEMGRRKGVVFEGRDMGTVVFPDADVKFYLDASAKVRSLRRYKELSSKHNQTIQEVEKDMNKRDQNDSSRALAPLKPADDAVRIDSTHLSADMVVERMLKHIQTVLNRRGLTIHSGGS